MPRKASSFGSRPCRHTGRFRSNKDLHLHRFDRKTASTWPKRTCRFGHVFQRQKRIRRITIGRGTPSNQIRAPRPSPIAFLLQASRTVANACASSWFPARRRLIRSLCSREMPTPRACYASALNGNRGQYFVIRKTNLVSSRPSALRQPSAETWAEPERTLWR